MKLFNKWDTSDINFHDIGLKKYINLEGRLIPHTFGNTNNESTRKSKINIVERLINKMMRSAQGKKKLSGKFIRSRKGCGKKEQIIKYVDKALDYIYKKSKQNPIQVLVNAVENAAPREDVTRLKKGGISYTEAVDVSPVKRLDDAIKHIALAAFKDTYRSKKETPKALGKEIILASKNNNKSFAVKRKYDIERIAQGSR